MIFLTLEFKSIEDGSYHTLTRRYSDDVSDEVLQEAVVELKERVAS